MGTVRVDTSIDADTAIHNWCDTLEATNDITFAVVTATGGPRILIMQLTADAFRSIVEFGYPMAAIRYHYKRSGTWTVT